MQRLMQIRKILAIAAMSILAVGALEAAGATRSWESRMDLVSKGLGEQIGAEGVVVTGEKNGVQYFHIRVSAKLADGETVTVWAESVSGEPFVVGSLEMFLGSASLELLSSKDPSDVFPLGALRAISVDWQGETILGGDF